MNLELGGVLPVDKPAGPTSHDVVARARKALRCRRVGHTGTLDPFATGLLLLCVGPATRLAEFLTPLPKTYEATARLGIETDTDDATGSMTACSDVWRAIPDDRISAAFLAQQGSFLQAPPVYSAKKLKGQPAYRRARRGETVQPEPRSVTVLWLRILEVRPPDVRFQLHCSAGTFVRAIARDAGRSLGTGAHLTGLRRSRIGSFDVEHALSVTKLDDPEAVGSTWMSPLAAIAHLPRISVTAGEAACIVNGAAMPAPGAPGTGPVAIVSQGELLAIGRIQNSVLRPVKVFRREQ